MLNIKKEHEDNRRTIYLLEGVYKDGKECTILEIKKGKALGGCIHNETYEYFYVLKGKLQVTGTIGDGAYSTGSCGAFNKGVPHMVVALEDTIMIEHGIKPSDKNLKDEQMRKEVDRINEN